MIAVENVCLIPEVPVKYYDNLNLTTLARDPPISHYYKTAGSPLFQLCWF